MEEGPVDHPGVPTEKYHKLGGKTLLIFFLQRVHASTVLFLLAVGLFAVKNQPFVGKTPLGDLRPYADFIAWGAFALFALVALLTLFYVWLVYINYKFFLGADALKIKRGILNKEEVAIPYRQIQNINVVRDLSFQLFGLSRLVILTAGEEDVPSEGEDGESEGILPGLDKDLAEWLQAELLRRANVQKITGSSA
jgi:uncharacterized membrane protein YdbT with pleckstrin-like domain